MALPQDRCAVSISLTKFSSSNFISSSTVSIITLVGISVDDGDVGPNFLVRGGRKQPSFSLHFFRGSTPHADLGASVIPSTTAPSKTASL